MALRIVLYVFGPYVSEPRRTLDLLSLDGLNFICCLGVLGRSIIFATDSLQCCQVAVYWRSGSWLAVFQDGGTTYQLAPAKSNATLNDT